MGNSASEQRRKILEALSRGPLSTLEARRNLDIMHPGGRVLELRKQGVNIVTHWSKEPTEGGKLHRVARYVLLSSGQ